MIDAAGLCHGGKLHSSITPQLKELLMIVFNVNDMTCGHCVGAVTKAVKSVDPAATVSVNLETKRVQIDPTGSDARELSSAIAAAGYTPVEVAGQSTPPASRGGNCCGSCH
jgi:copper chaperone